jgi:hypothetical protein
MSNEIRHNKTLRLAVVAVIALVLAFWLASTREPGTTAVTSEPALPGLRDDVNAATTIKLTGAEGKPIATLVRNEASWTIAEKDGYPAEHAKVRELLLKLSDAMLIEPKTSNKELHAKLGVQDVSAKDATGVLVEIEGLKNPASLIVGNFNGRGGDGTFVRRPGEDRSWLAKGNLTFDKDPANWLARDLTDVPASRIAEASIVHGGKTLRVFKKTAADANYQVADVPKGRELASEFVANGIASVLAGLRFDDVRKAGTQPPPADAWDVAYKAFDGLVVKAKAWQADGKAYANLTAELDPATAEAFVIAEQTIAKNDHAQKTQEAQAKAASEAKPAGDSPAAGATPPEAPVAEPVPAPELPPAPLAVTDPAKDREQRLAALNDEIEKLNARFEGWTFVLPSYKFANMNKTVDDLLKPIETKKK